MVLYNLDKHGGKETTKLSDKDKLIYLQVVGDYWVKIKRPFHFTNNQFLRKGFTTRTFSENRHIRPCHNFFLQLATLFYSW